LLWKTKEHTRKLSLNKRDKLQIGCSKRVIYMWSVVHYIRRSIAQRTEPCGEIATVRAASCK